MAGGRIDIQKRVGGSLVVNITRTDAVAVTVKDTAGNTVSMPDTITASKTYVVPVDTKYTISVKRNNVEIADTPDGVKQVVIEDGKVFAFAPAPADADAPAVGEIAQVVDAAATTAGWVDAASVTNQITDEALPAVETAVAINGFALLPDALLDENDALVDGPANGAAIAWDATNSAVIVWNGTTWDTLAVVTP